MTTGLFVTTSDLDESSGGGNVSIHEYNALSKFCDHVDILTRKDVGSELYGFPFAWDNAISNKVNNSYHMVHFNGHPFGRTISNLRYFNEDIKIVSSVPAHNIEVSREEHYKNGMDYDRMYSHMVEPKTLERYITQDREADLIIFPAKICRDYFMNRFKLTNKTAIIPHGCRLPPNLPSYPSHPSEIIFGYIGAFGPDKGVNYLVEAWNKLPKRTKLIFFGRDSEIAKHILPKDIGIEVYGRYKDLDEIMPKFDVYVQPSATEGYALGCIEAAAYGKPVIVSNGAGAHEVFTDEVDGFIVPARDSLVLMQKMLYFIERQDEVVRMGKNAYDMAVHWDWNTVEGLYIKAYEELFQ